MFTGYYTHPSVTVGKGCTLACPAGCSVYITVVSEVNDKHPLLLQSFDPMKDVNACFHWVFLSDVDESSSLLLPVCKDRCVWHTRVFQCVLEFACFCYCQCISVSHSWVCDGSEEECQGFLGPSVSHFLLLDCFAQPG